MANNNSSHYLMPTFDSEEAFNAILQKRPLLSLRIVTAKGILCWMTSTTCQKSSTRYLKGIPNSPILSFLKTDLQICARCVQ